MKLNNKLLGGTLLLAGTAMGGGLLALPLTTAETGFFNAACLMIACWGLMTATALLTVEASLWFPPNSNIISMTASLLHPGMTYVAWISYLLLFYSITAAYITSGADFLNYIIQNLGVGNYRQPAAILFTTLIGGIVYQGLHWVDYLNRWFMITKLVLYVGLVSLTLPHSNPNYWHQGDIHSVLQGFSVVITAFSYTNMIPSLRTYFGEDIASLKKAILIGSIIPLLSYLLWNMSIMGVIPLSGTPGLIELSHMPATVSALIAALNQRLNYSIFPLLLNSFSYVCILTTSLTCSFGLSDFLADGLRLTKGASIRANLIIYGTTFVPPLLIALLFPNMFITALRYAGIYCLVLFAFIPTMLIWRGRYQLGYNTSAILSGGKSTLLSIGFIVSLGISYSLYQIII